MSIHAAVPFICAATPSAEAFSIGGVTVYWQGILLIAAVLTMLLLTRLAAGRKRLPADTTVDLCLVLIPCGILGARLWFVLDNHAYFAGDFLAILRFWDGGLSIYGAIVLAALGLFVYALKKKLRLSALLDALTPGLLAAAAIVLWGDYCNQTGFGPEVTDPAQMWFPLAVLIEATDTIHYAIFFYECIWCVLTLLFVWLVVSRRAKRDGSVFLWAALMYFAGHAVFHALRTGQTLSNALSVVLLVCAAVSALLLILQSKRPLPAEEPEDAAPETVNDPGKEQADSVADGDAPESPVPQASESEADGDAEAPESARTDGALS